MLLWIKWNKISTQTNYLSLATTTPPHANPEVLNFLTLVFKQQITIVSNTKYTKKKIPNSNLNMLKKEKKKEKGSNKLDKQINTTNTWDFLLGGGVAFEFMRH